MGLFDRLFRRPAPTAPADSGSSGRRVQAITRDTLDLIIEMAKQAHPNEMGASLRAEGGVITEIVLVPGTIGGDAHAFLPLHALPYDRSVVGTVHSHPSPWPIPSDADKQLFNAFGHTHLIIASPYTHESWRAYDQNADDLSLEIVD